MIRIYSVHIQHVVLVLRVSGLGGVFAVDLQLAAQ